MANRVYLGKRHWTADRLGRYCGLRQTSVTEPRGERGIGQECFFAILYVNYASIMKIRETFQRYGALAGCHKLLYRVAQRCLLLNVTHLVTMSLDEPSDNDPADGIEFRPLSRNEFSAFVERSDLKLDLSLADRIAPPMDTCFGAVEDDRLIAYFWLATDSIEAIHNSQGSEESGVALSFPADTVYTYNAFVHPDHRGAGLYTQLVHAGCAWAHETLGMDRLISTVDWTNFSAMRSCRRQGRRSIGLIWRIGLFGRLFTIVPRNAKAYGVKCGKAAVVTSRSHQDSCAGNEEDYNWHSPLRIVQKS
jgi:RimJ/RimL family protein N-acetyltransferase